MRLLNINTFEFNEFWDPKKPKPRYVIASHRWADDGLETTFKDVRKKRNLDSVGRQKVEGFAKYIRENIPTIEWLWIDTCCINKEDAVELSEAINLMFHWYRNAELCVAYLVDVVSVESGFEQSKWFSRGWTLQELVAPRVVVFVTKGWEVIGNKGGSHHDRAAAAIGPDLGKEIAAVTGIPQHVLCDYETSARVSDQGKLKWMDRRQTTKEEDKSYALYGILGVAPGANYGEGGDGARRRLLNAMRQQTAQFRDIVTWISAPDPYTNHESARQRHERQTGAWLLQSDQYQSWKAGSPQHLWMFGKPGCGKTVLCSTAIEDIRVYCESLTNAAHAYFYFTFSDNQKQSYENLLRSLVAQLGWKEPGLSMLQQAYDRRSLPGVTDLEKIVLLSIQSNDEVFLLLDALDECPESGEVRQNVLEYLERLSQKATKLRMLITSRAVSDVGESMKMLGADPIPIASHTVDADIRRYVATQVSHDRKLARLDSATKGRIEETISQQANGMFRWAYCQLQELKKLKAIKPKYVRQILCTLPPTLDATYERMLENIDAMFRQEAITLLRWLAYAKSPPSLSELAEATIIEPAEGGCVDFDERGRLEDTLDILSGLVVLQGDDEGDHDDDLSIINPASTTSDLGDGDSSVALAIPKIGKDTKIRLAHFSVKEYLESDRILQSDAKDFHLESAREHRFLAESCLTYLIHYSRSSKKLSTEEDLNEFPLLLYAARTWYYHSFLQESGKLDREMALLTSEEAMRSWVTVHQPDVSYRDPFTSMRSFESGLYYASTIGLEAVVDKLLTTGYDVNEQGGYYGNALQAASSRSHTKLVQLLIDRGADINAKGGVNSNALVAATLTGNEKLVQLLLDSGADVNAQGGFFGNALQAASYYNYRKIMKMLIGRGADVNAQGGDCGCAIQAATWKGSEDVVQILIEQGADVNGQGGLGGRALQLASLLGYEKIVQILIDTGAEVNARGLGRYRNALQAAASSGHEKIVQILIDLGADVNAEGGSGGNALQSASSRGRDKVVQMLIDRGADVNAQGGEYSNALQAASARGHENVVQILLDKGANVNAPGTRRYRNDDALQAASEEGHRNVVQTLIDKGADFDAQGVDDDYFDNALQAASAEGYEKVVQMLIDRGADVNAQGGAYGNALQAAARKGHEKIVQILLANGASDTRTVISTP